MVCAVVAMSVLIATPALADGHPSDRRGSCSGAGQWRLRAGKKDPHTIEVRFEIDHVRPGQRWQLFLSDDGVRVFAGTRIADHSGALRAIKVATNRPGVDQIKGSGVNVTAGGSCIGAVKF
jgi:hypothetical protein